MEASILRSRTIIMSGSILVAIQNGILLVWTFILFTGIQSHPTILLQLGVLTNYLAFSIDLIAIPLLGVGFYFLSQCYEDVSHLSRTTGFLLIGWALPSFLWRLGGGLFDRTRVEEMIPNMIPQQIAQTLTQVFDRVYPLLAISAILLSLGLYKLNNLIGHLEEDVGVLETGRSRVYSGFAATYFVTNTLIVIAFLWIDFAEMVPINILTSILLLGGGALIGLLAVIGLSRSDSGHTFSRVMALIVLGLTVIWLLLTQPESFGSLRSLILIGAATVLFLQHKDIYPNKIWKGVGVTAVTMIVLAILFRSWMIVGTLETSNSAAWFVLIGLSFKSPILSLWGIFMFYTIYRTFYELSV